MPRGRLFATTRDELIECAALVRAMRSGAMDALAHPARAARHPGPADRRRVRRRRLAARRALRARCARRIRTAICRATISTTVVAMLADGVATSRGRSGAYLHYDRVNGILRGRRGARIAAITSGGAIPETANYNVVAEPDGHVVGTLDEDFAVESMAGDIFLLGTTSWRIRRVETGRGARRGRARRAAVDPVLERRRARAARSSFRTRSRRCAPRSTSATTPTRARLADRRVRPRPRRRRAGRRVRARRQSACSARSRPTRRSSPSGSSTKPAGCS